MKIIVRRFSMVFPADPGDDLPWEREKKNRTPQLSFSIYTVHELKHLFLLSKQWGHLHLSSLANSTSQFPAGVKARKTLKCASVPSAL